MASWTIRIAFGIIERTVDSMYVFLIDGEISEFPGNSESCLAARGRQVAFAGELTSGGRDIRSQMLTDPMNTIEEAGGVLLRTNPTAGTSRAEFRIADFLLQLVFAPHQRLDHLVVLEAEDGRSSRMI